MPYIFKPEREDDAALHGVYQAYMSELDAECEGLLPDRLYANFVLYNASDEAKNLALKAAKGGFNFQSWEWGEDGPERDAAVTDLTKILGDENEAFKMASICDTVAVCEEYEALSPEQRTLPGEVFLRDSYDNKVGVVYGKMSMLQLSRDSNRHFSKHNDDWVISVHKELDDDIYKMQSDAKFAANAAGIELTPEQEKLWALANITVYDLKDDGLSTDAYTRLRQAWMDLEASSCTRDMLDRMWRQCDPEMASGVAIGIGEYSGHENNTKVLANCWTKAKKSGIDLRGETALLRAYDETSRKPFDTYVQTVNESILAHQDSIQAAMSIANVNATQLDESGRFKDFTEKADEMLASRVTKDIFKPGREIPEVDMPEESGPDSLDLPDV